MEIEGVEIPEIPDVWPHVFPLIEQVTNQTGECPGKLYQALMTGNAQMVVAFDDRGLAGVLITELPIIKGKTVCNIRIVAGRDRAGWWDHFSGLEQWARDKGCSAIRCSDSRMGWERVLKAYGYRPVRVTLEKDISHGR
jgi:hypothetical protein